MVPGPDYVTLRLTNRGVGYFFLVKRRMHLADEWNPGLDRPPRGPQLPICSTTSYSLPI